MLRTRSLLAAVLVTACSSSGGGEPDGVTPGPDTPPADVATARALHYTTDLRVMESFPVQLDARMQVHNPTAQTVTLELPGGCPLLLQAYRDEARTRLAWDQSRAIVCTLQLQIVELAPNQQHEFVARTDAREVLGDSLPDGTYFMSARLAINDTMMTRPVGSVQLAVPR